MNKDYFTEGLTEFQLSLAYLRFQSDKPVIIWKFIVNRFNENEIEVAQEMANNLGIKFEITPMGLSDDLSDLKFDDSVEQRKQYWLPRNKKYIFNYYLGKYKHPLRENVCSQLFTILVVNPDGKIFPCCYVTDENNVFGDLLKDSFEHIWNNNKYLYSRSLFTNKRYTGPKIQTICYKCNNFKKAARG